MMHHAVKKNIVIQQHILNHIGLDPLLDASHSILWRQPHDFVITIEFSTFIYKEYQNARECGICYITMNHLKSELTSQCFGLNASEAAK